MSATAIDLFGPKPPRRRRIMAHAIDSGQFPDGKSAASFVCGKCGHATGWIYTSMQEARRGVPCSKCND